MLYVLFLFVVQGAFGAMALCDGAELLKPPPYSSGSWDSSRVAPHTVLVQYMSEEQQLHEVVWHTFGIIYSGRSSVESLFERSLLNGNEDGIFLALKSELSESLVRLGVHLRFCLAKNICVTYGKHSRPLCAKHLETMFPKKESKLWQINPVSGTDAMRSREVRLWTSNGGLSCTPCAVQGKCFSFIPSDSLRSRQMDEEVKPEFVREVCVRADAKLRVLEKAAVEEHEKVTIRFMTKSGVRWAVWDGAAVVDKNGKTLGAFLRDCVLQGTNLGYLNEPSEKHYAFVNHSLCKLLCERLAEDLSKGRDVVRLDGAPFLCAKDLHALPFLTHFGWVVVPKDTLHYPSRLYGCALTFAGVTIEGVHFEVNVNFRESLEPRNYLWALDHDALKAKKKNPNWYSRERVASDRMFWAF